MPSPYFSEIKFLGGASLDFIEVAVDAGTDVSNFQVVVYNANGTVRSTNALGTLVNTINGRDIYVIDTATSGTFNGLNKNGAVALVDNGTVTSFLSLHQVVTATQGPANGTTSTALGKNTGGQSFETTDDGATYQVQNTPTSGTVPCFLSGTYILTDKGERPVETLRPGDRVLTADAGMQPISWIGYRELSTDEHMDPSKLPIRIPAGALAPGVPTRDLFLSPNHRIVITHAMAELYFHAHEVLAPAKALIGYHGVRRGPVRAPVRYHHILFEEHQVIWANGTPSESLHLARMSLEGFDRNCQLQILDAVGHPDQYGPTARIALKPIEAKLLLSLTQAENVAPIPTSNRKCAA